MKLIHFHTIFCPDKKNIGIRTFVFNGVRNRNGRKDVSSSSSAADKNFYFFIHDIHYLQHIGIRSRNVFRYFCFFSCQFFFFFNSVLGRISADT